MGGYNTVCEILSLGKRAVVVPRVRPVEEQWIRARRMEELGLFRTIHPDLLTPAGLAHAVFSELTAASPRSATSPRIDLNGLPRMAELIRGLIGSARLADVQPMSPAAEATPIRHTGLAMAG
jgi:predicted glycosyltransferase